MKALAKFIVISIGLVLIIISVSLLVFGEKLLPLGELQLEREMSRAFGAGVSFEEMRWAPMQGGVALRGLRVQNPEGFPAEPAFACDQVTIFFELPSLLSRAPVMRHVSFEGAEFQIRQNEHGTNLAVLSGMLKRSLAAAAESQPRVIVRELGCDEAQVRLEPGDQEVTLLPITLEPVNNGEPMRPLMLLTALFEAAAKQLAEAGGLEGNWRDALLKEVAEEHLPAPDGGGGLELSTMLEVLKAVPESSAGVIESVFGR